MKTLLLFLATVALQADDKPKPIPAEYITIVNALGQAVQDVQTKANAAIVKLQTTLCKEAKLKAEDCMVNWQTGTYGKKPVEQPKASPVPSKP